MSYEAEVCQVSLNILVKDHSWLGVAQRRPVLVQQIHQLFCNHPVIKISDQYETPCIPCFDNKVNFLKIIKCFVQCVPE